MSTPWFFLSYARSGGADQDVLQFYHKLIDQMKAIRGELGNAPDNEIGFIDKTGIENGARWANVLEGKLRQCRVLVCLYSDGYFTSDYCGKEFGAFCSRSPAGDGDRAALSQIVPVLWLQPDTLPKQFPQAVADLQYANDRLGQEYEKNGLFLIKTTGDDKEYVRIVYELAKLIVDKGRQNELPVLKRLPPFNEIPNAWVDPPAAPHSLEAMLALAAPPQIRLQWGDNPPNAQGYYLERLRYDGRPDFIKIKKLEAGDSWYTDANIASGTKYRYRICAFNSGGRSDYVESGDVETPGQAAPPMPSGLVGKALWTFQVGLSWIDNSGGRGSFKVERCKGLANRKFEQVGKVNPGVTVYKDRVLIVPRSTYHYRVCASDGASDSDYADEVEVSTTRHLLVLLLVLILAVAAVAASIQRSRCLVVPLGCPPPPPSPTPTPEIIRTYWSDGFDKDWPLQGSWDMPGWYPEWEEDDTDGVLPVRGADPGVVKQYFFDNYELIIDFPKRKVKEGTKIGWLIRAYGNRESGYRGYCFYLQRTASAFLLSGYWGNPKEPPATPPEPQVINITDYGEEKDRVEISMKVEGDLIFMVFQLRGDTKNQRRQLKETECFTALAHIKPGSPKAGFVGVFAGDKDSPFYIDSLSVNPLPPQNGAYLVKCKNSGPDIYPR